MKFKQFWNNQKKKIVISALALATITGTYTGNENDFPPLYTRKTGTSAGINLGLYTEYEPDSKFYGLDISLVRKNKGGTTNGARIGLATIKKNENNSKLNGLEISLGSGPDKKNQDGERNYFEPYFEPETVNGIQIGLINSAKAGNIIQLGLYNNINSDNEKHRRGFLFNYGFKGKD